MKINSGKICAIFNVAPHYRAPIYQLIDQEFDIDFYFGDRLGFELKLMEYEALKGFKGRLKYIPLVGQLHWQKGAVRLALKPYDQYILNGGIRCLSNWVILIITKLRGRKIYMWTHGYYGDETKRKKIVKGIFHKSFTKILLYGEHAKKIMINEGFKEDNLLVIYNSMNCNRQKSIRDTLSMSEIFNGHFGNSNPVLIFIGRIQINKRLDLLIEAVNRLRSDGILYNVIIIGKEIENTGIHELVQKYGLENQVWLFGPSYDEKQIAELIFNSNVCVSPGNVGLLALHSLVYGTPVITHNSFPDQRPEFEAIEDGVSGMFFEKDSVHDLMKKIITMVDLTIQDRDVIRKNCYKVIERNYNPNNQIQVLGKLFK